MNKILKTLRLEKASCHASNFWQGSNQPVFLRLCTDCISTLLLYPVSYVFSLNDIPEKSYSNIVDYREYIKLLICWNSTLKVSQMGTLKSRIRWSKNDGCTFTMCWALQPHSQTNLAKQITLFYTWRNRLRYLFHSTMLQLCLLPIQSTEHFPFWVALAYDHSFTTHLQCVDCQHNLSPNIKCHTSHISMWWYNWSASPAYKQTIQKPSFLNWHYIFNS